MNQRMDYRVDWNKLLGFDTQMTASLNRGLALPPGLAPAMFVPGFQSIADIFAEQRAAMLRSLSLGVNSAAALLEQQERIARLAMGTVLPFRSDAVERLTAGLSASSLGVSMITRLDAAYGSGSLAVQQGELLAESYKLFSVDLFGERPEVVLGGPEARLITGWSQAAAAAFLAGAAVLDDVGQAEIAGVGRAVPVRPNVYDALYDAIGSRRPGLSALSEEEVDREIGASLPWRIFETGKLVVELRHKVNQAGLRTNNEPVFRATTETELISFRFSQDIVSDEDDFDGFVDRLHKYVFESSDDARTIRVYLAKNPPLIADLATLRHYYSHDPESRPEKERAGSLGRVRRLFTDMTGKAVPESPEEWRQSQLTLLERIAGFFEDLLSEIVSPPIK